MFRLITRDQLIQLRDSAPPEQVRVYDAKTMRLKRIEEPRDYNPKFNEERIK